LTLRVAVQVDYGLGHGGQFAHRQIDAGYDQQVLSGHLGYRIGGLHHDLSAALLFDGV